MSSDCSLAVWAGAEGDEARLQAVSRLQPSWNPLPSVKSAQRQQERQAARCAAVHLLGGEAERVGLETGPRGEPLLVGDARALSLSHSKGWAAAALSRKSVGVDLELIDHRRSLEAARMFMHETELRQLSLQARPEAFYFLVWSVKEGLYKALNLKVGDGVSFSRHLITRPVFDLQKESRGCVEVECRHPELSFAGRWSALRVAGYWLSWGRLPA